MTHLTDEELDALVKRAGDAPLDDKDNCFICYEAVVAIAALRAQLAAANARADRAEAALAAQPLRSGWADVMSSAIQRFEVAAAVNGSATWNSIGSKAMAELLKELSRHVDRAKAALAAQIEVDAGIADDYTPEKHSGMTLQAHVTGRNIASAIRNQPHDRTALDRLLADAEAKALRRAADEMEDERAKQAILAMITKEGEA